MDDIRISDGTAHDSRSSRHRSPLLTVVLAAAAAVAVTATVAVAVDYGDRKGSSAPAPSNVSDARDGGAGKREVDAAKILRAAADRLREEEKDAKTDVPRDDQFIYTRNIVKETDRKTGETDVRPAENWESVDRRKRGWVNEIGGKGWWVPPLGRQESTWPPPGWEAKENLPQDPVELIRYLAKGHPGAAEKPKSLAEIEKAEWMQLQFLLKGLATSSVEPEGLRPAAFDALAKVPGMRATAGVKDGEGDPAVGVWFDHRFHKDQMLVIDEDSHEYLGDRAVRTTLNKKKSYDQFIHVDDFGVVDKVKQRP
ncbi:hypothetical protein H181DRAFT_00503 [Streptomyces sp. WMMB 714]|nr:hypothetical protein H181DRAFT_00503 [Streptomyces sp. WMMB 714]